jgi:Glycosyltransferase like family 2
VADRALSIIIPNLHSPVLDKVLDALMAQVHAWPAPVSVWVVGQDKYGMAKAMPGVTFLETPSPVSPARARNMGAAAACDSDTLIFLDADCVPQDGWLRTLVTALDRWPDAAAISAAMMPEAETFVQHCGQISGFHEHLSINEAGPRSVIATFSLLVPRSVWDSLGGLDSRFRAAEDVDFSVRATQLGMALYLEPTAMVFHMPSRKTWRALWQHAVYSGSQSIQVRLSHSDRYEMPAWTRSPLGLRALSLGVGVIRTLQIYAQTPNLWRYWRCLPWVFLSKVAWCWGAAAGLGDSPQQ